MEEAAPDESRSRRGNKVDKRQQFAQLSGSFNSGLGSESEDDDFSRDEEQQIDKTLARKETKAVTGLRVVLFLVLAISTVLVACAVYFWTSNEEQVKFERQFEEDANKILQSIGTQLEITLGAIDMFALNTASYAKATGDSWPLVVVPNYAARAEKMLRLTNVVFMDFYPFVENESRMEWEAFTEENGLTYVNETNEFMIKSGYWEPGEMFNVSETLVINQIAEQARDPDGNKYQRALPYNLSGPFMPRWQAHTPFSTYPYNRDYLTRSGRDTLIHSMDTHKAVIGDTAILDDLSWLFESYSGNGDVLTNIFYPILDESLQALRIFDTLGYTPEEGTYLGSILATIVWSDMMASILPGGSDGIHVYFQDTCLNNFTYQINGPQVEFLGAGDAHEGRFDYLEIQAQFLELHNFSTRSRELFEYTGVPVSKEWCPYTIRLYPSTTMETRFKTNNPAIFTAVAVFIFVFTSLVFLLYDWYVERRQRLVMDSAVKSNEVVAAFYPKEVRERIYSHNEQKRQQEEETKGWSASSKKMTALSLRASANFTGLSLSGTTHHDDKSTGAANDVPIADFYPETTVMFADLAGFTSWSSTREPTQVFRLLESLYQEFDKIAKRRGVFKIETIGDCYLAVCGLPKPRKNHAVVLTRFAAECRDVMNSLTPELELTLGPGTGDLLLRAGLHSGSCTGGVLRGDKNLFTLFGDTVNTASRMESNGKPNRIQVSQKTADLLIKAGKESWLTRRPDLITAKGKGKMQTYWVEPHLGTGTISTMTGSDFSGEFTIDGHGGDHHDVEIEQEKLKIRTEAQIRKEEEAKAAKIERLVDWNVTMLEDIIKKLLAQRYADPDYNENSPGGAHEWNQADTNPRDELVDSITICPKGVPIISGSTAKQVKVPIDISRQLHSLVTAIAHTYQNNAFHNFEHTSHVTMSFRKMMQRIIASKTMSSSEIRLFSFAMAEDPLAEFAVLFAVLIHSVDHPAITNSQLVKAGAPSASKYENQSINEQHAIDTAWTLFMSDAYSDLRKCMFQDQNDLLRFRRLVVNGVLATDISDAELSTRSHERWAEVFDASCSDTDRQATVVLEHLIETATVSHAMQPWMIYQKWSKQLFEERYAAHLANESVDDPSVDWYESELRFFEETAIPLANKLRDHHVLGEYSHEFVDCACENRLEWENKGHEIVEEMLKECNEKYGHPYSNAAAPPAPPVQHSLEVERVSV